MNEFEVYFTDDSEYADFEANQKGFRLDVYVKIVNEYFNVNVYDIVRLNQEFEIAIESEGYYSIEPNLVLVKDVNREEIKFCIGKLFKQKYFDNLKPLESVDINELKRV